MRKLILITCVLALVLSVWKLVATYTPRDFVEVYFLDVGQGDAIAIRSVDNKWALVDGGRGSKVLGELAQIMPLWQTQFDLVVASHPDADHIQGLLPVLERYQVQTVVFEPPPPQEASQLSQKLTALSQQHHRKVLEAGDSLSLGCCVSFRVLWPGAERVDSKYVSNERSLALVMTYGSTDIWLGGDLGATNEETAAASWNGGKVEVLKVGHHGSKTSTSPKFLEALRSDLGIISAGENNSYGHPHAEVLKNLAVSGIETISTAECGRIHLVIRPQEYSAESACGVEYFTSEI